MTGHLLGAAAAIEAIIAIKSINDNIVPPTINVSEPDPEIPAGMQLVFNKAVYKEVKTAMSNAFGFGGHNSTVVFKELV
ncbi:3-oxoacyl-[acyl-carrier-protein] synthase 2 [compost metagenome]